MKDSFNLPKHFQKSKARGHQVFVGLAFESNVIKPHEPYESNDKILHNRKVVVVLWRIDDCFAQKPVLASVLVKEAPVHFKVPPQLVAGAKEFNDQPQVKERVLPVGFVLAAEVVLHGQRAHLKKGGRVFERVRQVRECVRRVLVAAQTLQEPEPGGQDCQQQWGHVERAAQVTATQRDAWTLREEA